MHRANDSKDGFFFLFFFSLHEFVSENTCMARDTETFLLLLLVAGRVCICLSILLNYVLNDLIFVVLMAKSLLRKIHSLFIIYPYIYHALSFLSFFLPPYLYIYLPLSPLPPALYLVMGSFIFPMFPPPSPSLSQSVRPSIFPSASLYFLYYSL